MAGAAGRTGPLAAPAEGREIEGRTPTRTSRGERGGVETVKRFFRWLNWMFQERKRRQRWERYFKSGGLIR